MASESHMTLKSKLQGVLSLSAASAALLQSIVSSEGKPTKESPGNLNNTLNGQIISKQDTLILVPAHQEELLRLYAGHSSHASHSSHYSGAGGGYSAPIAPAPGYYVPSTP